MSGYYEQPDPDDVQETTGSGLRKQLEEALSEIKNLRQNLEGEKRQETVTEAVKGLGLNPAVAELIPADEADPKAWLEQRAGLFGVQVPDEREAAETQVLAPADDDPALVAEREAVEAMQAAEAAGGPSATVANDLIEKLEQFDGTKTEADLLAFLKSNGMA